MDRYDWINVWGYGGFDRIPKGLVEKYREEFERSLEKKDKKGGKQMNKAIEDYLEGYTANINVLQPAVTIMGSGETFAIAKDDLKEMDSNDIMHAMFDIFDGLVENWNIAPDALESQVMIFGMSTLAAHQLVQFWMKERGI